MDSDAPTQARRRVARAVAELRDELGRPDAVGDLTAAIMDRLVGGEFGPDDTVTGWVYEAVHDAGRREVFDRARRNGRKISAADVIDASRLYTPGYIVDFLLQNSLGALWHAMYPHGRERWPLMVREAVDADRPPAPLRDLRLLDPCCGCGAFLLPAFDMLTELYADERAMARAGAIPADWAVPAADVPRTIVERNLHGADLDAPAVAIASELLRGRAGRDVQVNLSGATLPLGTLAATEWSDTRFDVVCTNPPYVGFRMLDPALKRAVRANDPLARSDLAVAFQSRCFDLLAEGGLCATVTPAAWLTGRESLPLRRSLLSRGGPRVTVALGQRVFEQAPLLFIALSVLERGRRPAQLRVLRPPTGSGSTGLAEAVRSSGETIDTAVIAHLPLHPFLPGAPPAVLALNGRGPRLGDLFRSFDGLWTGDNARDTRHWWEIAPGARGWRALSGGQGHDPWAGPIRRRVSEADAAGQPQREGAIEYARVAGGRLAARLVDNTAASLAGIVTLVPRDGEGVERIEEVLAIFNGRIGNAWLRTLTSGLNFNPGYAAEIPLGRTPPSDELRAVVRELVALKAELARRDPTADAFVDTRRPWDACELTPRIAALEASLDGVVATHLGLAEDVVTALPPVARSRRRGTDTDDYLMVHLLRHVGFRWPCDETDAIAAEPCSIAAAAAHLQCALDGAGAPAAAMEADLEGWITRRFAAYQRSRFARSPVATVSDGVVRLLPATVGDAT